MRTDFSNDENTSQTNPYDDEPARCLVHCPNCGDDGWCRTDCAYCAEMEQSYSEWVATNAHDCPKQAFMDDPITSHYGVGGDFVGNIACSVCDAQ
jgi:hypothetical protein